MAVECWTERKGVATVSGRPPMVRRMSGVAVMRRVGVGRRSIVVQCSVARASCSTLLSRIWVLSSEAARVLGSKGPRQSYGEWPGALIRNVAIDDRACSSRKHRSPQKRIGSSKQSMNLYDADC